MEEASAYIREHYPVEQITEEIAKGVLEIVREFYEKSAAEAGAEELLRKLKAGASPWRWLPRGAYACGGGLNGWGIREFFQGIYTCTETGAGKKTGRKIYQLARRKRFRPGRRRFWYLRDAPGVIRTAAKAGFVTVGVEDPIMRPTKRSGNSGLLYRRISRVSKVLGMVRREKSMRKTALTIAGSDSSGARIQADIKTMLANGVLCHERSYGADRAEYQRSDLILESTPEFLGEQLDNIFTDIYPDAVKIGMVSSEALIRKIADKLKEYGAKNIVVDPVMVATSGAKLIDDQAIDTLKECLLPLATVLTPNIPEAEVLSGRKITSEEGMEEAAKVISETYHCAVLCKGGHQLNDANDLLYREGAKKWFYGKRIDNPNTHGTGCTLSSAIASNLAKGYELDLAVERAKEYISGALGAMLDLGKGSGPMDHGFDIQSRFSR